MKSVSLKILEMETLGEYVQNTSCCPVSLLFLLCLFFPSNKQPSEHCELERCALFLRRRQWHPTPVLLPGKSHGPRSLVGCSPWVAKSQTRLCDFTFIFTFRHWRRKWQPTPVFLPGESQGRGSLVDCCLWGRTESDMTEAT